MKLELDKIRRDGGTQPRAELLIEVIEDYAEQMRSGAEFPAITVFFDGKDYWLADGFHRVEAATQARPDEPIEADIIQGTQSDAQWYSYSVNRTHGLRRTREDRLRAIRAALVHPKGTELPDRQIAEHVGASATTVGKVRKDLESSVQIGQMRTRTVSRGDTTYPQDTSNIGKTRRRDDSKPSRHMANLVRPPQRMPNPMEKMTALTLPHNPVAAARALIEVFDADYLRVLAEEITNHLDEHQPSMSVSLGVSP